jgi:NADH-ubiquinone oxidoreductase chain 5
VLTYLTDPATFGGLGLAVYRTFNSKWAFDSIYNNYIITPALKLGLFTSKILDRGVVELLGPHGLSVSLYNSSRQLATWGNTSQTQDTGTISTYGLFIFIGAISLTLLLFAPIYSGDEFAVTSLGSIRLVLLYGAAFFYITSPYTRPLTQ